MTPGEAYARAHWHARHVTDPTADLADEVEALRRVLAALTAPLAAPASTPAAPLPGSGPAPRPTSPDDPTGG